MSLTFRDYRWDDNQNGKLDTAEFLRMLHHLGQMTPMAESLYLYGRTLSDDCGLDFAKVGVNANDFVEGWLYEHTTDDFPESSKQTTADLLWTIDRDRNNRITSKEIKDFFSAKFAATGRRRKATKLNFLKSGGLDLVNAFENSGTMGNIQTATGVVNALLDEEPDFQDFLTVSSGTVQAILKGPDALFSPLRAAIGVPGLEKMSGSLGIASSAVSCFTQGSLSSCGGAALGALKMANKACDWGLPGLGMVTSAKGCMCDGSLGSCADLAISGITLLNPPLGAVLKAGKFILDNVPVVMEGIKAVGKVVSAGVGMVATVARAAGSAIASVARGVGRVVSGVVGAIGSFFGRRRLLFSPHYRRRQEALSAIDDSVQKAYQLVDNTIENIQSQLREIDRMRTKPEVGMNETEELYSAAVKDPRDVISFAGSPDFFSSSFKAVRDQLIWQDPSRSFAMKQFADLAGQEAVMQTVWSAEALKAIDLNVSKQVFSAAQKRIEGITDDSHLDEVLLFLDFSRPPF